MHRSLDSDAFASTSIESAADDVDPMASVGNIADAMLVFACGLMLALVAYWNVDISPDVIEITEEKDLSEVENIEQLADDMASGGSGYTELGMVYQDPSTGKMYMITPSEGESGTEGVDASAGGSGSHAGDSASGGSGADAGDSGADVGDSGSHAGGSADAGK